MDFTTYPWEDRYIAGPHNLLTDFYIPVLKRSTTYDRIAGYFRSHVLVGAAQGLASFIETGKRMRLLVGVDLTEADVTAINRGEQQVEDVLAVRFADEVTAIEHTLTEARLEALAWLIATDRLAIKIGVPTTSDGDIRSPEDALWHEKVLVFEDAHGHRLHADGSVNETLAGWTTNRESFSVHRDWQAGQHGYVESAVTEFETLWNDNASEWTTMPIPAAVHANLVAFTPPSAPTTEPEVETSPPALWPPQQRAVTNWLRNDYHGVFEMATGTGKTRAALCAADLRLRETDVAVILVPYTALLAQWQTELESTPGIFETPHVTCCSSDHAWKDSLGDFLLRTRGHGQTVVLATMDTARTDRFQHVLTEFVAAPNLLVIADEVHHLGSPHRRRLFETLDAQRGRLGLSATPDRMWDADGTDALYDYFGKTVIEYGLAEAIDPTVDGQRFLCPYEYHLHPVALTPSERQDYLGLSTQIARIYATVQTEDRTRSVADLAASHDRLHHLLLQRARIRKRAARKIRTAVDLVTAVTGNRCLVYCADFAQLEAVKQRLLAANQDVGVYTSALNADQRARTLAAFEAGCLTTLLAVKCLDEGVDIPMCDAAILLSHSRNEREFVQRRGRVLRTAPDKEQAVIHDLVVLPYPEDRLADNACTVTEAEWRLFQQELDRVDAFRQPAENSAEILLEADNLKTLMKDNVVSVEDDGPATA